MNRDEALAELPLPHAVALRLRDASANDETIARALGIEPEGIPALLRIAEAKLSAEMARGTTSGRPAPPSSTS